MGDVLRGFGFTFDLSAGSVRNWYIDREGVQRWADNDAPVNDTRDTPALDGEA